MIEFKVEHIQEVNSTNSYLKELTKRTRIDEGTVILADFQTSGKGRGTSKWLSDRSKNLTFSFLVKPGVEASHHFSLAEFVSLALMDTLKLYGINSRIKWPNDIYVTGRKIAGILIENVLAGNVISSSVIGIGFNVNQEIFPGELPNPVSMKLLLKRPVNCDEVFKKLLVQLSIRYEQIKAGIFDLLHAEYSHNIYGCDKKIHYYKNEKLLEGIVRRISENGEIFIESEKGELTGYLFGEIQILQLR